MQKCYMHIQACQTLCAHPGPKPTPNLHYMHATQNKNPLYCKDGSLSLTVQQVLRESSLVFED